MDKITFLTYADVVESGACLDGVISACKEKSVWFGDFEDLKKVFGENQHLLRAAKVDGNGYGDGYGNGNGYGDGYGNGNGYGDGNGNGYGDGYGDGNGDGDGDGYGDGNGNGYGDGYGNGYGDGNGDGGI